MKKKFMMISENRDCMKELQKYITEVYERNYNRSNMQYIMFGSEVKLIEIGDYTVLYGCHEVGDGFILDRNCRNEDKYLLQGTYFEEYDTNMIARFLNNRLNNLFSGFISVRPFDETGKDCMAYRYVPEEVREFFISYFKNNTKAMPRWNEANVTGVKSDLAQELYERLSAESYVKVAMVVLFGDIAKSQGTKDSDLCVAVISDCLTKARLENCEEFNEIKGMVSCVAADVYHKNTQANVIAVGVDSAEKFLEIAESGVVLYHA